MPKQDANRDAKDRVRRPPLTIDESSGEGELIIEPTNKNPIRFICRFKPDVAQQVEALKFLLSYTPSNIAVPETPSKPETAHASAPPQKTPKPSARTKRLLARLLKEQRTTQAESAAEEADA